MKLQHLYHQATWLAGSQFTHRSTKNADYSIWLLNCRRELTRRHAYVYANFISIKGYTERKLLLDGTLAIQLSN